MKKILLFVSICGLLLSCEINPPEPQPEQPEFAGSYDVITTGKIYLIDDEWDNPLTPDSINLPENYSQSMLIEQFNNDSLIISYEDSIQEPFMAKIENTTIFTYKAPFIMDIVFAKLTGTRDGKGIQINTDSIVINDSINGRFEVLFLGDTLTGRFNGTLRHIATRKK